jgi:bifunctional non-homologous end joining protein LigD
MAPRFVVEQHDAAHLHWDLRLERDGVLVCWALPRGVPLDPHDDRIAVRTEDQPLAALAAADAVVDGGTYACHEWSARKVEVTLRGDRLEGRYGLHPIGGEAGRAWAIHRLDPPSDPERLPLPRHLPPMLARAGTLPSPQEDEQWGYEVKWDGVRALLWSDHGHVRIESRTQREITERYPDVHGLGRALGAREALLDGELVAFEDDGRPSFERLQRRMHVEGGAAIRRAARACPVTYVAFDLLHLDGRSLLELPYAERRARLEQLALEGPAWRTPRFRRGGGAELLAATREHGLEGVVAKRLDSRYESGRRSDAWRKLRHRLREQLAIGGWTEGEGERTGRLGSLLLGVRERPGGPLRFAGGVGSGFTEAILDELLSRLGPLARAGSPFDEGTPPRGARFVEPRLVADVEFSDWTAEGRVRQAVFKGLCGDRSPEQLVGEAIGRPLPVADWEQVLFPATGFTKGDLIAYYTRIASTLLPHLRDRPLALRRWPEGVEREPSPDTSCPAQRPAWVQTASIYRRAERRRIASCVASEPATLAWAGSLAAIELHLSLALARDPRRPTAVVFELEPGAPAGLAECAEVALVLHGLFERLGLGSVVKTSGGGGLHVLLPLGEGVATHARTKPFARRVAALLEQQLPELAVSSTSRRSRAGRVLVDWSANAEGATTLAPYSLRAGERPLASTPLAWAELRAAHASGAADALAFGPEAVLARVAEHGDPFAPMLALTQRLPEL